LSMALDWLHEEDRCAFVLTIVKLFPSAVEKATKTEIDEVLRTIPTSERSSLIDKFIARFPHRRPCFAPPVSPNTTERTYDAKLRTAAVPARAPTPVDHVSRLENPRVETQSAPDDQPPTASCTSASTTTEPRLLGSARTRSLCVAKKPEHECVVCLEFARSVAAIPCGHVSLCVKCASHYTSATCPTCAKPVTDWLALQLH